MPLTPIKDLAKGADSDSLVFESGSDDTVTLENHVGSHVVRHTLEGLPPADWPPFQPGIDTRPAPRFLETYRKLVPFASTDETRRVLTGVLLDPRARNGGPVMVATDGCRLSRWKVDLPVTKPCIVPVNRFLPWTGLAGEERIGICRDGTWMGAVVGPWTYQARLVAGVYPSWWNVIPQAADCGPGLVVDPADIPALQAFVRSLPPRHDGITLGPTPTGSVEVTGSSGDKAMTVELTASRYMAGHTVILNGAYLLDALAAGFRDFRGSGRGCPLYAETADAIHVLMPLRISASAPPSAAPAPDPTPATANPTPTAAGQAPQPVPAESAAPNPEPTAVAAESAAKETKVNEKNEEKSALETLQAAYEVAKAKVREASQALADVADAIKLAAKEDRQRRNEVESVRAGLAKLQAIRV